MTKDGSLLIHTSFGEIEESKPRVYQQIAGQRVPVEGRFKLTSDMSYTFEVSSFRTEYALVIDPTLLYSTYLGGSAGYSCFVGCSLFEEATGIAVDSQGNAYVSGYTASRDFPTTPGAFQTTWSGTSGFVTKFNALGSQAVYSTYLGATNGTTIGYGIAVDASGDAYITGFTGQGPFPTTPNAYQRECPGFPYSFFFSKMNATGNALIYSTCLGTISSGGQAYGIAVDSSGKAYIAGNDAEGLPTTEGAYQRQYAGGGDAFLTVFDPSRSGTASLLYSTYLGGSDNDEARAVAVDPFGMAYVTGVTASANFPITPGSYQTTFRGTAPFVAKLNPMASGAASLIYSTYLGASGSPGTGIAVDSSGNAYVAGYTSSADYPTTAGAFQTTWRGVATGFVTKLNAAGNQLVYSTFLSGSSPGNQGPIQGIAVDAAGNATVVGYTGNTDFPVTKDAFQSTFGGNGLLGGDAFISKFNATGTDLIYSSYLGGKDSDRSSGVALDSTGDAYVTGFTSSFDFPITPSAFQLTLNPGGLEGPADAFVTKFPIGTGAGLSISSILPSKGGNNGTVTPEIIGTGFHNGLTVKLVGETGEILGNPVTVGTEGRTIGVTFDLRGAAAGARDLVVINPVGVSATLPAAFTVQEGGAADVRIRKIATTPARGRPVTYVISVQNVGTVDSEDGFFDQLVDDGLDVTAVDPPAIADPRTEAAAVSTQPLYPLACSATGTRSSHKSLVPSYCDAFNSARHPIRQTWMLLHCPRS